MMATIDLKLKTYDELQFEIMNLTTKNYLQQQELDKYKNIVDELKEDIPCLLEIINRNEKDIKVYQDEWIAIKSVENKLKELKGE